MAVPDTKFKSTTNKTNFFTQIQFASFKSLIN
jgi:hypothetical protein